MAFSEIVIQQVWKRAGGAYPPGPSRCECDLVTHDHGQVRCNKALIWGNRGREGTGAWEAHHRGSPTDDSEPNCRIFCWDCHTSTF